jgi:hypothetical protein
VLVIKAIALVSSPKFVKKSPNTKPKDGIDPNATTCNKKEDIKLRNNSLIKKLIFRFLLTFGNEGVDVFFNL